MYETFYNLHTPPFENTPDPRFFFASDQHREALAAIEYTIRLRKGYVLITGGVGSGKTTVGRTMVERCAASSHVVQLAHGPGGGTEVVRHVLRGLHVPHRADEDRALLLDRLRDALLARLAGGKPVVLLVDEAQTWSDEALDELRLLSNFDTATRKLTQVVLVGQPELRERVCTPRLAPLRQRIVLAKTLAPLSLDDTRAYIAQRLRAASRTPARPAVAFSEGAVREVHRIARGVPRMINFTCDNCLLLGFVREAREVLPAMVHTVAADMLPSFDDLRTAGAESPRLSLTGST